MDEAKCDWCGDTVYEINGYEREGNGIFHPFCAAVMRRRLGITKVEIQGDTTEIKSLLEGVNPDNLWLPSFERAFDIWAKKHPDWRTP